MKSFQIPIVSMSLVGLCLLSGLDAPPAHADFIFGTPTNLGPTVNTSEQDDSATMPADGLSLFFGSTRVFGFPYYDIYVMTRDTVEDDWSTPVNLGAPVNTAGVEVGPCISADGLTLVFGSDRPGGLGGAADIWMTTRETKEGPWADPVNLGPNVNSAGDEWSQSLSADTLELYFATTRPGGVGGRDLWMTSRATTQSAWGPPVNLGPTVNSPYEDDGPVISADGLCMIFRSARPGGYGGRDIWITTRASKNDPWRPPVNPGPPLNGSGMDGLSYISPDGSTVFLSYAGRGGYGVLDSYQAPIIRFVDFNGDGQVDGKDVLCMVAGWSTDDALLDIGPFAWGDGTVGLEDLTVLAGYLGKEVSDPTLVAHWTLDETEGMTVADSAGGNNGYALGNPVWQPDGGQVDGALLFDGVDDFITVPAVLNPADGSFSLLAWVKGGASGQVIISQTGGANWLMIGAEGKLMTELQGSGRDGAALQSQTIITDGKWHRIGLVWDGSRRMLYVDGVVAAEDTQSALPSSGNGLYIGTGKGMEPGTFWSGLIDDVRIYSRAVRP